MTYWYPGLREVIEDLRRLSPRSRIALGGVYATLCPDHAERLEADLVLSGRGLGPLWQWLGVEPEPNQPALWEAYPKLASGVLKLADGCPFRCTYCAVPLMCSGYEPRPLPVAIAELELLCRMGAGNVAFYDDALLFRPEAVFIPFLERAAGGDLAASFHTPNGLNARFVTPEIARLMVRAGFKTFYLGFESASEAWQRQTGGKVHPDELARAVRCLRAAGARPQNITAYVIIGHPDSDAQDPEAAMRFAADLGVRVMLAEFAPVPGTPDGEKCRRWADMGEPLWHNKTAFTIASLGAAEVSRLKTLCRQLNEGCSRR